MEVNIIFNLRLAWFCGPVRPYVLLAPIFTLLGQQCGSANIDTRTPRFHKPYFVDIRLSALRVEGAQSMYITNVVRPGLNK